MSKDDDRRGGGEALHIVGEPSKLLGAELAHTAGLEIHHVDESDEMDAIVVEGIPARALGVFAVTLEVRRAGRLVEQVVLARNVVHVESRGTNDLSGIVKLVRLGKMGNVAGVDHERWLGRGGPNLTLCVLDA